MLNYDITFWRGTDRTTFRIYGATSLLDAVQRCEAANPGITITKAEECVLQ